MFFSLDFSRGLANLGGDPRVYSKPWTLEHPLSMLEVVLDCRGCKRKAVQKGLFPRFLLFEEGEVALPLEAFIQGSVTR